MFQLENEKVTGCSSLPLQTSKAKSWTVDCLLTNQGFFAFLVVCLCYVFLSPDIYFNGPHNLFCAITLFGYLNMLFGTFVVLFVYNIETNAPYVNCKI